MSLFFGYVALSLITIANAFIAIQLYRKVRTGQPLSRVYTQLYRQCWQCSTHNPNRNGRIFAHIRFWAIPVWMILFVSYGAVLLFAIPFGVYWYYRRQVSANYLPSTEPV